LSHRIPRGNVEYSAFELGFNSSMVSPAAYNVISTLQAAGYYGYLVGGCVRDLIVGIRPKDFDVTTDATPEIVKSLFRRSRIIGRRFKIVHVIYGREIVEISTYRTTPHHQKKRDIKKWFSSNYKSKSESNLLLDYNVYGTIDQDVMRRDFTVNALYYDPSQEIVLDFLQGIEDTKEGILRVIGNMSRRFTEDPVRLLRIIRFIAKLEFTIDQSTKLAIVKHAHLLAAVPAARLYDEVLKLLHHGHAVRSWYQLNEHSIAEILFPQVTCYLATEEGMKYHNLILSALEDTDSRIIIGKPVIPAFLFAVLFWPIFRSTQNYLLDQGMNWGESMWMAGDQVFAQQQRIAIPRRVSTPTIEIWTMQSLLERRRPRSIERLLKNCRFRAAYDFLILRQQINEVDKPLVTWWEEIQACDFHNRKEMIQSLRMVVPNQHRDYHRK